MNHIVDTNKKVDIEHLKFAAMKWAVNKGFDEFSRIEIRVHNLDTVAVFMRYDKYLNQVTIDHKFFNELPMLKSGANDDQHAFIRALLHIHGLNYKVNDVCLCTALDLIKSPSPII